MRTGNVIAGLVAALMLAGCSGVVPYRDEPVPSPTDDGPRSQLSLAWGDWESSVPDVDSDDTFDFVVRITNAGDEPLEWSDPCPTYHWAWEEGATTYGEGYALLNCQSGATLASGDTQEFLIKAPAPSSAGATGFGWELVDPYSCNVLGASYTSGTDSDGAVETTVARNSFKC